jgi:Tfp pilus assembly protein PilN
MKYAINLFPSKKSHVTEHLGIFIAHYFRYALVLTMGVVIIVFFLRVRVDQQLADEREKLAMKKAIITTTRPLRNDLENAQRKISLIKSVFNKQDLLNAQLDYITAVIPKKSTVKSIMIDEKQTQIEAMTSDFRVIQLFINKLSKDARYSKIRTGKILKEGNKQYSFSVVLEEYIIPEKNKSKT